VLGRLVESVEDLLELSPLAIKAEAAEANTQAKESVLTIEQYQDASLVRMTIYEYYFKRLNFWGYPYEEQGFQLTPKHWNGHAHNIYLQYGTDFGIIMMALFILLIFWSVFLFVGKIRNGCNEKNVGGLAFLLIPTVFGMFEYSWGVGSVAILLLFVVWRMLICSEE